ncbi:MAG: sodium:solute symporter family protein [Firmicutes bacterium]|nr:sodium:solute symporter family protein [Bacillota bacterium]
MSTNLIVGGILLIYIVGLVIFTNRGFQEVTDLTEFTTSGHRLGLMFTVAAFVATWISASSVTGIPSMLFTQGAATITGWFAGWFFATTLMAVVAYKIRMPEKPSRTLPELFKMRFEPYKEKSGLQVIAAISICAAYIAYIVLQIKAVGMIVSTVTGLPYAIAVFAFLLFLAYTSSGGMWTVAWGDLVNTSLIIVGLFAGGAIILYQAGGWSAMWQGVATTTAPALADGKPIATGALLSPLGTFGGAAMLGIFLSNSLGGSVSPHMTARMMGARNTKTALLMCLYGIGLVFLCFIPLLIFGFGGKVLIGTMLLGKGSDWLMPTLLMNYMSPVVGGVVLAAILAAALSTANAQLLHNSLAFTYDIVRNVSSKPISDEKFMKLTKVLIIVIGVLLTIAAIWPPEFIAMLAAWTHGLWCSTFFIPLLLGLYWKRMNRQAAYASMILGTLSFVVLYQLGNVFMGIPAVLWGVIISIVVSVACSFIFPPAPKECWEPFFEINVSDSTKEAMEHVQKERKKA